MTNEPLVSIVTPTRNRAALLEWTLRSIRGQTYSNVEHIVVDGASTDDTVNLLRRFESTYRLTWSSQPDGGMYPAINRGLALGQGEILAYLNSDDLYFPWTIEVVVDAFRRNPSADLVFGDALAIDDATGRQTPYMLPPFRLDALRRIGFLAQPAVFWRRRVFDEEGPFDETLRYVADCDYWMRVGTRRRFHKVNEFLAVERNHPSTLREAVGSPVWSEVERVRSRYVALTGPSNAVRSGLYWIRAKLWVRWHALRFLAQSLVPRDRRRGPWSNLLNADATEVSRWRFVARAIPVIGRIPAVRRALSNQMLRPSRHWLEPQGGSGD